MQYFEVHLDHQTSKSAGASGMFQVVEIKDHEEKDRTNLVDQGTHYASLDDLKSDIAKALGVSSDDIDLNET